MNFSPNQHNPIEDIMNIYITNTERKTTLLTIIYLHVIRYGDTSSTIVEIAKILSHVVMIIPHIAKL